MFISNITLGDYDNGPTEFDEEWFTDELDLIDFELNNGRID